jgi:proline iminopeptidase
LETFRTRDDRRLTYRLAGSGPLLVCHPGGPGFSGAELDNLGGLDATRTLLLLDPRGTGASDPASGYQLDGYADDLDDLRQHLGLQQLDLLGFSHGGAVAAHYAATHPPAVRRLVLAGGLAAATEGMEVEGERLLRERRDEPWYGEATAALKDEEAGNYDDMAALWARMAPLYFGRWDERYRPWVEKSGAGASSVPAKEFNSSELDIREELPNITAPTLVITGTDDFVCGPSAADELVRGIPHARLVLLEHAGHMMYVEQPEDFRNAVEEFLAR